MTAIVVLYLAEAAASGDDVLAIGGVGGLASDDVIELWSPGVLVAERCKVAEREGTGVRVHRAQDGTPRMPWPSQTAVLVGVRFFGIGGRVMCQSCGALVGDRSLHMEWHFGLDRAARRPW